MAAFLKKIKNGDEKYTNRYNLSALLNIFLKVCDAISYAHSNRIVHLDLKPDNIHVGSFGEVLVIDWGLAKNLDRDPLVKHRQVVTSEIDIENTLDGFVKGTIGYMAPEQARGENSSKDERTDIYSLGAILYSILTQSSPYSSKDIHKALKQISAGEYKPLNESIHPTALCAVINKAMSTSQKDRYQSVADLSREIQLYLMGFATNAQEANAADQLKLFIKRHSLTLMLVASFLLLLLVSGVIFILNLQEKERVATSNAEQAIENAKLAMENEKKARANELKAKESEQKAIEHFNNLVKATEEKRELESISMPLTLRRFTGTYHEKNFGESLKSLDKVHRDDIADGQYWFLRGKGLTGELRFKEAKESLEKSLTCADRPQPDWKAEKLLHLLKVAKITDDKPKEAVLLLSNRIRSFIPEVSAHMFYTSYKKVITDDNEKAEFLKKLLLLLNPNLKEKSFNFKAVIHKKGFELDLSRNMELKDISPLAGFPYYKIDLSYSKNINSFIWLKNSPVEIVDISGIDSKHFKHHVHLGNLKELYIRDCFFRYQWLSSSKIQLLDFTGSTVDLAGIRMSYIPKINLCGATLQNIGKLNTINGVTKIIFPEHRKLPLSVLKNYKKIGTQVIPCKCKDKSCKF